MSRFLFPADHVRTAQEAHAAAVAASRWRRSFYPRWQPTVLPAPVRHAPPAVKLVPDLAIKIEFGRVRVADVIDAACTLWGIKRDELIGHDRHPRPTLLRHAVIVVARRVTGFSFPELGRRFGGRDHTSILHAVRRADHHAGLQAAIAELVAALDASAAPTPASAEDGGSHG